MRAWLEDMIENDPQENQTEQVTMVWTCEKETDREGWGWWRKWTYLEGDPLKDQVEHRKKQYGRPWLSG